MKACRNTNPTRRPAASHANIDSVSNRPVRPSLQNVPDASHVNRYSHPIRIKSSMRDGSTEELLSYILEALSRQADLLDELLRRTESGEADTI